MLPKKAAKETTKGNLSRGGFLWNPSPTAKGETARRFPPLDPPSGERGREFSTEQRYQVTYAGGSNGGQSAPLGREEGSRGTFRYRSFTILRAKRPLRTEEEEQANTGALPLGAKRSHEPGDDDGAPFVTFHASGKSRPRKGPRQEARNGPVRRKRLTPAVFPLLTLEGSL